MSKAEEPRTPYLQGPGCARMAWLVQANGESVIRVLTPRDTVQAAPFKRWCRRQGIGTWTGKTDDVRCLILDFFHQVFRLFEPTRE